MNANGKKEIGEAVLIAALSALATTLINWGMDTAKEKAKAKLMPPKKDEDSSE